MCPVALTVTAWTVPGCAPAVPGCLADLMLAIRPAVSCICTTMCHLRIEIGYCWMVRVIRLAWTFVDA